MKKELATILAFSLLIFAYLKLSSSQQEYFRTEWQLVEDGLTRKCYELKIQNLYSSNLDFNLQAFFSDTNFPLEQINDVEIYEWKAVPKEFPVYTIQERCDYQVVGNDTQGNPIVDLVCWNETVQNGTITKNVVEWKPSKMQVAKYLEGKKEELKTSSYSINIPKFGSKPKYDDFGNVETENGIKKLKICFNTPIVRTLYGYGSSGKIGIRDLNGNFEEDPWWNSTWQYRRLWNISNPSAYSWEFKPVEYNINFGREVQTKEIRITMCVDENTTSCTNEIEIPYQIRSNTTTSAVIVVEANVSANSWRAFYIYYGNPSASPPSYSNLTFNASGYISGANWNTIGSFVQGSGYYPGFREGYTPVSNGDWIGGTNGIFYEEYGVSCTMTTEEQGPIFITRRMDCGGTYAIDINVTVYKNFKAFRIDFRNDGTIKPAEYFIIAGGTGLDLVCDNSAGNLISYTSNANADWILDNCRKGWVQVISNSYNNVTIIFNESQITGSSNYDYYYNYDSTTLIATTNAIPSTSNPRTYWFYPDDADFQKARQYNSMIKTNPIQSIGEEEVDIYPPTYSSPGHNNTEIYFPTLFYIKFDDNVALHPLGYYIFSTNLTGSWVNDSAVNFTTTPSWANVTKILYTSPGTVVGYRWYAWDNSSNVSNVNVTPIFTLTAVDTKAPTWFNNQTTGSSTYGPNNQHYYSVTWSDNYEPDAWTGAYFSTNITGSWVNYTAVRSGNATTYTIVPPAGTHCWRFFAWDSSNNVNATPIWCKTVNKATPSPAWIFNPPSPITYSTQTNASCNPGTTDSGYSLNAWRNGTNINSELNQYVLLPAGTWNYTCSVGATQNYTSASVTSYYTVNKATPSLQLTITPSNNVVYPTQTTATGSGCPSQLTCNLYRNNTLVANPDTQTLPIGTYLYVYNTSGNQNYTSASTQSYLYVTEALNPEITLFSPQNTTYYGDKIINIEFKVTHQTWNQIPTNVTYDNELVFSSNVSNNTNITITKPTACGTHFVNITAVAQGSSSQAVYFTIKCGMEIEVFDEQSLEKICYNLAIMNETYAYNLNSTCNKTVLAPENLPAGYSTIVVSNSSYISRTYYANLTQPYYVNMKAYLLQAGSGVYITTFVYSREEPSGVKNALTNAKRFINNSWVVVEQKLTDEQGKGYFYLYPWSLYRIEGMKGNKYKQIESYYPNPNYVLYILLEDVVGEKNKTWVFDTVYVEIKPKERYVANMTTFEFTVSAQENDLEYFGVKFYKYYKKNYTLLYEQEVSSSSGGTIEFDINVTNHTAERFEFITYFKRNNYDLWNFTSIYIPWQSHSILPAVLTFFASGGFVTSDFATHLIATFVAFAAAVGIGRKEMFGGIKGASLIFVGVLAFFAIIGMVRWEFIIACGLVALLINFAKGLVI